MTETAATNGDAAPVSGQTAPRPVYTSLDEWVTQQFLPIYRRPLGGEYRWCATWWEHAEAIMRLTALWHAWETLRRQPGTGIAVWLRDHLDHQLPILLGRSGPFAQCSEDEHIQPRQAGAEQVPPGWWNTDDDAVAPPGAPPPTLPALDTTHLPGG